MTILAHFLNLDFFLGIFVAAGPGYFLLKKFLKNRPTETGSLTTTDRLDMKFLLDLKDLVNEVFENRDKKFDFVKVNEIAITISEKLKKYIR